MTRLLAILAPMLPFVASTPALPSAPQARVTPAEDVQAKRRLSHDIKRQRAIEWLGTDWIKHPEYRFNPRHSNHLHLWWPHRSLKGEV